MKTPKQVLSCLIFCAILLLPVLAIGVLQIGQAYLRFSREERLQTEKLVRVVIPVKELVWEEEEKEAWLSGRLFDVASFAIEDSTCYLTGVYDDEETEIAGSLLALLFSESDEDLLYLLFLLECFSCCVFLLGTTPWLPRLRQWGTYFFTLPFPSYWVLSPPPRD